MTLNIKIEIIKIFSLELNFSSEKKIKQKEHPSEESNTTKPAPTAKQ